MPDAPCVVSASFTVPSPKGGSRGASPGAHAAHYVGRDGACESLGATVAPLLAADPPRIPLASVPGGQRVADGRLFGSMEGIGATLSGTGSWAEAACRRIQDLFQAGRTVLTLVFSFATDFMESVGAVCRGAVGLGRAQVLRVRSAVARAMERVAEEYDSMGWVAGVHTNTGHVHCHVSVVEQGDSPRSSKGKVSQRCLRDARRRAAEALADTSCGIPWEAVPDRPEKTPGAALDGLSGPVGAAAATVRGAAAEAETRIASAVCTMGAGDLAAVSAEGPDGCAPGAPWPILERPMVRRAAAEERSVRARALSERAQARLQVESVRPSDTAGLQAAWLASLAEAAERLAEEERERSRRRFRADHRGTWDDPAEALAEPLEGTDGALGDALRALEDAAVAPALLSEARALGIAGDTGEAPRDASWEAPAGPVGLAPDEVRGTPAAPAWGLPAKTPRHRRGRAADIPAGPMAGPSEDAAGAPGDRPRDIGGHEL